MEISGGLLEVPKIDIDWDTVILKLKVRATRLGRYSLPYLDISGNGCFLRQTFEHGVDGVRYVDISLMALEENTVRFTGKNLVVPNQEIELFFFNNKKISNSKILVVSPHPDDAEIAAFGLYSSGDRNKTYVVTVTAGDDGEKIYGDFIEEAKEHYEKKGELRVWNSITVPLLGGILPEHTVNLGYFDSRLHEMHEKKSEVIHSKYTESFDINRFRQMNYSSNLLRRGAEPTWNSLVADFSHILKVIEPDIIVAPYPAFNSHSDHTLTTEAVFEAIQKNNLQAGSLFLYAIDDSRRGGGVYPLGGLHELTALPPNFQKYIASSGCYAHQLNMSKQRDKFFALEAMNDIRVDYAFATLNINGKWHTVKKIIKKGFRGVIKNIFDVDRGYLRRVVKANELFFVFEVSEIYNQIVKKNISG